MNITELKEFIATKKAGTKLDISTSQYSSNTTSKDHRFDAHSSAPAVRSLIKQGLVTGWCGWRYYEVTVL